jgi:hypothetical protein
MSLTYKKATRRPSVFRRLTTFTVDEFDTLVKKLRPEWNRREHARLSQRTDRVRAVGQGRPYAGSFETMVLLAVVYLRTPAGNAFLALLFGIDEVTVRTWRKRILPLLSDRFVPDTAVSGKRKRINDVDEFLKEYPELKELIGDGCELKTQRPKRKQGKNYTGKSKRHVKKFVLITNRTDGLILGRTVVRPGSVHDKRILDEDPLHKRLDKHKDILKRFDSAWTGEDPILGYLVNKRGRRGHPLTYREKRVNKKLSKIRIGVEHAIRRIKTFRRLAETVVIRMTGGLATTLNAAINLANFAVLVRRTKTA